MSAPALLVDGEVAVEIDGAPCRIVGTGPRVIVETPTFGAARSVLAVVDALPVDRRDTAVPVQTLEIRVRDVPIASSGTAHHPGPLSRAIGAAPARLSLGGVVRAFLSGLRERG
ncbi:hypothetical protein ACNS7O_11720 [Haloferacaceae archaeon DSL9]